MKTEDSIEGTRFTSKRETPPPSYDSLNEAVEVKVISKGKYNNEKDKHYGASTSSASSSSGDEDEKKKEPEPTLNYYQIFRYADNMDLFLLIVGTVAAAAHGAALPVMFILFGDMTNSFVDYGKYEPCNFTWTLCNQMNLTDLNITEFYAQFEGTDDLNKQMAEYSLYYTYLACGILVLASLQIVCWMMQAVRQVRRIRVAFFRSILRQDISFFDLNSAGELNTRLADDINKIQDGISDKVSVSIQMLCRSIAGLIIGFVYGWKLALVILAVSPLLGASATVMFKITTAFTKKELDAYAKAGAVAEEVLSSIRTVVAFDGQQKEINRYEENLKDAKAIGIRKGLTQGLGIGSVMFILFSTYGLAFWYGSELVFGDELDIGTMLTTFFGVLIGAFSLGSSASNMEYFAAAKAAAYKIYEIIDRVPEIDSMSEEGHKPDRVLGTVTLKDVEFTYPSRTDVQILHKVSFTAETGKTTALCGQSGCGKSTCIQLIQRFYDAQNGSVELDGIDVRTLNVRWLREHIGVVSQEPILFDTTIAENIRYGRDGVTDEEIKEATKKSNAYDFIMRLPNKFDTMVGEGGAQMSGGQKQRIAIARAIVRDPKILLLDEATSALDTESESIVQSALDRASQGRTTIVIAHRLSTIRNADKIVGFHEGQALEEGSHDELLQVQGGIYQNLVNMQSYSAEEGGEEKTTKRVLSQKKPHHKRTRMLSTTSHGSKADTKVENDEDEEDKEEEDEDLPEVAFSRIMALNKPELFYIIVGCCGAAVNGGVQPCFAILFSEILNVFSLNDEDLQRSQITLYSLLFVAMGLATLCASALQMYSFGKSGEELTARLRSMGFKAMLRQEIGYFDDHFNSTGALTTRLATDASRVQGCTGVRAGTAIQSVFALGVALGIAFAYGWQLTLLTLAFVPFMIGAGVITMKVLTGQSGQELKSYEKAGSIATEATLNMRTVASLTKERGFFSKYEEALQEPYRQSKRKAYFYGVSFGFSQCIVFFAYAATFRFGAWLVEEGLMEFENVYKCLMAVIFGAFAVGQTSSFAPDYAQARISAGRLFKLLDREPAIDSYSTEGETPDVSTGSIDFTGIKFTYPTRPDVQVLKGLTTAVRPGQTVALVGQSGCGKSTCIQLLERFYDPVEGVVTLDRQNTKELQLSWLRSQFGIVSQEPVLFDRSIADNIRYGDNSRSADLKEVIAAAKNANIHSFIEALPDGYDTNVGSKGAQLSGGQKQRVAIARALLRNPKVLLLDEATSALDTESEKIVQAALDAASEGRTCIVIAHRLSTVKNADVIAVIENGNVVESGTHNELIALKGSYFSLVNAQLHGKKSDE
ncbi:ATP-dependent translocase ABCB1-like [Clavelina lepadiformis]|uniref:ATP-dependent translocase ABCB1-like n=1 Tax=Clavelina lepadiformis TaxID=159417 RepID=UPI00404303DE